MAVQQTDTTALPGDNPPSNINIKAAQEAVDAQVAQNKKNLDAAIKGNELAATEAEQGVSIATSIFDSDPSIEAARQKELAAKLANPPASAATDPATPKKATATDPANPKKATGKKPAKGNRPTGATAAPNNGNKAPQGFSKFRGNKVNNRDLNAQPRARLTQHQRRQAATATI